MKKAKMEETEEAEIYVSSHSESNVVSLTVEKKAAVEHASPDQTIKKMYVVKNIGKELMENRHMEEMRELAMEEPSTYLVLLERMRSLEAKMERGFSAVLEKENGMVTD